MCRPSYRKCLSGGWWGVRMDGTSEDHLVQSPCSKQGQLMQFAKDHVQLSSEWLQGWRLQNLSRQPVHVYNHFCRKKKSLSYVWMECHVFSVGLLPLGLSLGTAWKNLTPASLLHHFIYVYGWPPSPSEPSLLRAKQRQLSQLFHVAFLSLELYEISVWPIL